MKRIATGVAVAVIASLAGPASASVYSENNRIAAWRGPTYCHGDLTEHTVRLVNNTRGERTFRVRTSLDDYRVSVGPRLEANASVTVAPGETGWLVVTYRSEVLYHRAGLGAICG